MIINIQCLRGVAALLVLIFHLVDIGQNFGQSSRLLDFVMFGQSGVDIFFVISGFIIYFISTDKFRNRNYQKLFLIKRFFRIYPVYWLYTSLLLLALYSVSSERLQELTPIYVVNSYLLVPQKSFPLLAVGWTLIHEIFFYILFSFLLFFNKRISLVILFVWCIFIISASFLGNNETGLSYVFLSPFNLEFILGCFIAYKITDSSVMYNGKILTIIGILGLIIGSAIYYSINQDVPNGMPRILIFGVPSSIILYGAISMEKDKYYYNSLFFHIGNASYSIYLSHAIIIWVLGTLYYMIMKNNYADYFVVMVAFFLISIGFGVLSYLAIEKPVIKIGKKLSGKIFIPGKISPKNIA